MAQERSGCGRAFAAGVIFLVGLVVGTYGTCALIPLPRVKGHPEIPDMGAWMLKGVRIAVPIGAVVGLLLAAFYLIRSQRRLDGQQR